MTSSVPPLVRQPAPLLMPLLMPPRVLPSVLPLTPPDRAAVEP